MYCPVCDEKAKAIDVRMPKNTFYTVHRTYECTNCLTRFKSSEKIIFSSIPSYIRSKFISEGKR